MWCVPPGGVHATCPSDGQATTGSIVSEHAQQVDSTTSNPTATPACGQVAKALSSCLKDQGKMLRRPVGGALSAVSFPGARERPLESTSSEVERPRHVKDETHTGCHHRTLGLSWPGLDALFTPIRSPTSAGMPDGRTSSFANSDAEKGQRCIAGQRV